MSGRGGRGTNWRGRWKGNRGRGRVSHGDSSQTNTPQQRRPRQVQASLHPCPYKKWLHYFPDDAYIPDSPLDQKIKAFIEFFEQHISEFSKEDIERKESVTVDYADLTNDMGLMEKLPSFAIELREQPEITLHCIGIAMYQVIVSGEASQPVAPVIIDFPFIQARVINYDHMTPLMNLKANYFGKFVAICGTVVRVGNVKPLVTKMAFTCNLCGEPQSISLPDGKYTIPSKCPAPECRGRSFTPQRSSLLTTTIDWQTVRIQEIMDDDLREAGRIPRTVECELTADLVDSCVPGDMVTVTGIVKVTNSDEPRNKSNKDKCMFLLYIHANAVNNNKGGTHSNDEPDSGLSMEFTLKELYAIQEIQAEKNLFRLIVGSLCPSIYGHEMVKAGLMLGLFGGTQRFINDKNRIPVRGNPHVLVVGDPGLGKSQMLQAVSNIAPRGVYVCGNTTSTSGLTVTLTKDGSSGDYSLEAGALVLGDQGCCCIDEFDKMGNQHQALLEAMEQQSISIAKAGVVCSLPARTSIIAAANPAGGHYNKAKTVSENLKMGSALLSRFDLVFILLDKPDEEMDCMLSKHVMALHTGKRSAREMVTVRRSTDRESSEDEESRQQWEADKPLSDRLKVPSNHPIDAIPGPLLRKYVAYARKYVHPKLTAQAAKVLQDFYLCLRREHQAGDSTPITMRQLESLIRLTEARARLELREKATRQDADDVVHIMKCSLVDTYSDGLGNLDFQRSQHGSGMSSKAQGKRFIAELGRIADREYNSLFTIDQMRQVAKDLRLQIRSLEDFIYSLNNQGFLLKKGARVYQLQIASCL